MGILKRAQLELPTELSQDEFNLRARELAETNEELTIERETQKEAKAGMKLRLEQLEQKRTELARIVKSRKEPRLVDVEHHANYARGVVEYYRMDTGAMYGHRPLTADDRQLKLLEPPAAAPAASESETKGTVTWTDPDTGKPVTMTLEELEKSPKRLQRLVRAQLAKAPATQH